MFKGYKVICVTPAGRRRYMKLLAAYILASPIVDRWDIWQNTNNPKDIAFFKRLAEMYEKVRVVEHPTGVIGGNKSINDFFPSAMDRDSIYIRFDDDIVWVAPNFFESFLEFRVNNPQYFLVFPLIVNNAICSHLLQREGKLNVDQYITANALDPLGWKDAKFAYELHKEFVKLVRTDYRQILLGKNYPISLNRVSINCMSWFGEQMALFEGKIIGDEEEYLTVVMGSNIGLCNVIFGKTAVAHYAFYPQRDYLDKTDILSEYEKLLQESKEEVKRIYREILDILKQIDNDGMQDDETKLLPKIEKLKETIGRFKVPMPYIRLVSLSEVYKGFRKLLKNNRKQVGG